MTRPNSPRQRYASQPRNWRTLAACRDEDPDLFFPDRTNVVQAGEAKKVCARCPVADRCLQFALDTDQRAGMWGGLTEDEIRKLKGRRKTARVKTEPNPLSWDPPKPRPAPIGVWRPKPTSLDRVLARREELLSLWNGGAMTMKDIAKELRTNQSVVEEALRVIGRERQAADGMGVAA